MAKWLHAWSTDAETLVLVGASGGHTLPTAWLRRFDVVHAFDLDPLAPALFRARHRGVRVQFHREDVFWRRGRLDLTPLRRILTTYPDAAIVFTNVLGQVLLEGEASEAEWEEFKDSLRRLLGGRAWASYHDRYTFEPSTTIDHLTGGAWTNGLERTEFDWDLTPSSRHRIEAVRAGPR